MPPLLRHFLENLPHYGPHSSVKLLYKVLKTQSTVRFLLTVRPMQVEDVLVFEER